VRVPDDLGKVIFYSEAMRGDGCFDDDERDDWLKTIADAINETPCV
jgi:gluconate kinase